MMSKSSIVNIFKGSNRSENKTKSLPPMESLNTPNLGSIGGAMAMPPTFGYIAPPPINNVTQPLNLSTQETAFNAEIHDHYTPVDRVNDLVKKLDEANQTVQKQREKILTLQRDLARAQSDKHQTVISAAALKVSH